MANWKRDLSYRQNNLRVAPLLGGGGDDGKLRVGLKPLNTVLGYTVLVRVLYLGFIVG
jgi:hypothetical protein